MSVAAAALLWLVIGFVLANLPFLTERRFLLITRGEKSFVFRLLELLVGYTVTLALGFLLEGAVGRIQEQTWNFYAITLLMFLVLAYPGFVWRYLRRRSARP
ncbi:MAG: DUF2818 family protein [Burkholderiaceae bacterium]|jgi:hypothetical protein|nr:DUF2818 family protein [Burkholderiaceae bacterium]